MSDSTQPESTAALRVPLQLALEQRGDEPEAGLALVQQSFFFAHQFFHAAAVGNAATALRLHGPLDVRALERAYGELFERHEQLRTTFHEQDGAIRPQLHASAGSEAFLSRLDLSTVKAERRASELARTLDGEACRRFDLTRLPLLRATLIRLDEQEHLLVLVVHHIVADGVSFLGILHRELGQLYGAYARGLPYPLQPLRARYAEFVAAQAERNRGSHLGRRLEYWRKHLLGAPRSIDLPTDRARPAMPSGRGGRLTLAPIADLREPLTELSRQLRVSLHDLLLSVFFVQLHRYSAQTDMVVGMPFANRSRRLEQVFGCMINTLPMRARIDPEQPFGEFAGQVRTQVFRGLANADVSFEKLVEHVGRDHDSSRSQIHQVVFNYMPFSTASATFDGLAVHVRRLDCRATFLDLVFEVAEHPAGLELAVLYSTDLYEVSTMQRFAAHYEQLLRSVVRDPGQAIGRLPLLTRDEQLGLERWNRTELAIQDRALVHELFERWAERTPDAPAIELADGPISYRGLNQRANRLARALLAAPGTGANSFVGIYLERGPEVLLPILAVLKAGAAYVPVDADSPGSRASAIFERAGVQVVLTSSRLAPSLQLPSAEIVCLDRIERGELGRDLEPHDLRLPVHEDHAAYVLFTSGSTGAPKGVVVEHRQIRNYLATILPQLGADPGASFAMVSTFAADLGLAMLFGAPCSGGHLHIIGTALATDPARLADYYRKHRIDFVKIVPTHMEALLQSSYGPQLLPRKLLILAGDRLTPELVRKLRESGARCRIFNHYGPTETCISMLTHEVKDLRDYQHRGAIPLGRPIGNVQCHVLDERMQRLPVGVPGELYIGGACVSRGYLQRPDLTAERFVADPFAGQPEARMYRSGDRVRYWPDGSIEFLARIDGQVKIRGYRVELGEVEAALRELPALEQVAVVAREDGGGEKSLCAYYVTAAGCEPRPDEVRAALAAQLPKYMLPAHFVQLPALPTTPNGKLDRKALPSPTGAAAQHAPARFEAPADLRRQPLSRWLYQGAWHATEWPKRRFDKPHTWLLLMDELGIGEGVARELEHGGERVVRVRSGDAFAQRGDAEFQLDPDRGRDGFLQLAQALEASGRLPDRVAHFWLLTPPKRPNHRPGSSAYHHAEAHGFATVVHLAQALHERGDGPLHLWLISSGVHALFSEPAEPEKATALGACAGLSRELPRFTSTCVDIELPVQPPALPWTVRRRRRRAVARVLRELDAPAEGVIAHRNGVRYQQRYEPLPPALAAEPLPALSGEARGPVLVTGALDSVGASCVRTLCAQNGARLLLLAHSERASAFESTALRARALNQIPELRALPAERWQAVAVNLTDLSAMTDALRWGAAQLGPIRAVVHAAGGFDPRRTPLASLDPNDAIDAIAVAVQGLRVLDRLLEVDDLDSMLLCSAASLPVRAPGTTAAAAINAFYESYAASRRPAAVHAIAFGPLQDATAAADEPAPFAEQVRRALAAHGIGRAEEPELLGQLLRLVGRAPSALVASPIALGVHDRLCAEAAQSGTAPGARPARAPRDEIERKLLRYFCETLEQSDLRLDDDFFERGGHSLAAVKLFARIQRGFGLQLPLSELFTAPTVERAADRIRRELEAGGEAPTHRYLVPIAPGPGTGATPLFVVHGALGNVLNLRHLGRLVGQDRPFYALQARGLFGQEPPHATFEQAARDYLAELRQVQPQGPYLLGGFCIGGNIAYEMAQQLANEGETVALLAMLDSYAPDGDFDPPNRWDNLQLHAMQLRLRGCSYVGEWARARASWEASKLRKRFAAPDALAESDPARFRSGQIHTAMRSARSAYRVRPYAGRVVVYRPRATDQSRVGRFARMPWDSNLWSPHCSALEVHEVPGDHDGCVLEPAVRTLAARLRPALDAADDKGGGVLVALPAQLNGRDK